VKDSQSRLKNRFLVSKEILTSLKSRLNAVVHIDVWFILTTSI